MALVRGLIEGQFPEYASLPIRVVDSQGWDNRTFRLGDELSVRLPSAEGYADQVAKEHRWLPVIARDLPFQVPVPLAMGVPANGYPWHWSIYRWLEGEDGSLATISDRKALASDLACFLRALHRVDAADGPAPGRHNFYRGGSVSVYDSETREAIRVLGDRVDGAAALAVWETALGSTWDRPPVWVHGDVAASNFLVTEGKLGAVIDFGCSAVGDPACDLTIAWTVFEGESREAFRAGVDLDTETWERARGWAIWKALITLVKGGAEGDGAMRVVEDVVGEG